MIYKKRSLEFKSPHINYPRNRTLNMLTSNIWNCQILKTGTAQRLWPRSNFRLSQCWWWFSQMPEQFSSTVLNYTSIVHHNIFGIHKTREIIGKPNKGHLTILPILEVVLTNFPRVPTFIRACLTEYKNKCTQR